MNFKIKISKEVDSDWNECLSKSKYSTAFQTSNWINNYKKNPNTESIFIQIESNQNEIVGQLAIVIHKNNLRNENKIARKLGVKFNISSVLTWSYGPVIHDVKNYTKIISKIISTVNKIAKEKNIVMIRGSSPPLDQNNSNEIFIKNGFNIQPWSTQIIKLNKDVESFYSGLNKNIRYDIRKSKECKFMFEMPNNENYLKEFYKLKNEEYQRDNRKISPIANSYKERWENLYKNGIEKIFLVKEDEKIKSGISNIIFNYYLIQHGVANSSKKSLAGIFLTWETIKWAIENNYKF